MSFVFCQLEFLASTITLNPFSRISSLKREREEEEEEEEEEGEREAGREGEANIIKLCT